MPFQSSKDNQGSGQIFSGKAGTRSFYPAVKGWTQDYFKSWDGTRIFYRFFAAPGAKHTMILLHGYGEHSERYQKFSERLKGLPAQMAIMDFRGMGRSEGARGDIHHFEDYFRDISAFVEHLRVKHGIPKQFILFGHSMGGLVAVHWALKNPEPVRMLVLSAPFFNFRTEWLARILNWFFAVFIPRFIFWNPVRVKTLTHQPDEIATHTQDPLILRFISARLAGEIMRSIEDLRKRPILSVPFPVAMLSAGDERVVDPVASRKFFDRLVAPRKERFVFEGFYHEIFNEIDQQKVFNVLKTIIEDCV
ncbi:MAG TPA: lysophospholipase [Candidatus Omnitrophota bacterium]|nr:lysophospholipase [Candidatus Omnitrophota bacterium]HRY85387.1 lysophospholipase [Candidatus Omnitrophota bacterium]